MDSGRLRVFMQVAQSGGLNKAARALHMAPQSVSEQVAKLEREVGVPLFDRLPSGARLTQAGETFLEGAGRLLAYEDELLRRCREAPGRRRLAIGQYPLSVNMSAIADAVRAARPDIDVDFVPCRGIGDEMLDFIEGGVVDVAEWTCPRRVLEVGLGFQEIGQVETLCLMGPSNPLARKSSLSFADIAPMHVAAGSSFWAEDLAAAMREEGLELKLDVRSYGFQEIMGHCHSADGVFLVTSAYASILPGLKAVPFERHVRSTWGMAFRSLDDPGVAECVEAVRTLERSREAGPGGAAS